jgi:hypothetical protein
MKSIINKILKEQTSKKERYRFINTVVSDIINRTSSQIIIHDYKEGKTLEIVFPFKKDYTFNFRKGDSINIPELQEDFINYVKETYGVTPKIAYVLWEIYKSHYTDTKFSSINESDDKLNKFYQYVVDDIIKNTTKTGDFIYPPFDTEHMGFNYGTLLSGRHMINYHHAYELKRRYGITMDERQIIWDLFTKRSFEVFYSKDYVNESTDKLNKFILNDIIRKTQWSDDYMDISLPSDTKYVPTVYIYNKLEELDEVGTPFIEFTTFVRREMYNYLRDTYGTDHNDTQRLINYYQDYLGDIIKQKLILGHDDEFDISLNESEDKIDRFYQFVVDDLVRKTDFRHLLERGDPIFSVRLVPHKYFGSYYISDDPEVISVSMRLLDGNIELEERNRHQNFSEDYDNIYFPTYGIEYEEFKMIYRRYVNAVVEIIKDKITDVNYTLNESVSKDITDVIVNDILSKTQVSEENNQIKFPFESRVMRLAGIYRAPKPFVNYFKSSLFKSFNESFYNYLKDTYGSSDEEIETVFNKLNKELYKKHPLKKYPRIKSLM